MTRWTLSVWLLCITLAGSTKALAFVDEPYITPTHPSTRQPISVHVTTGWCHAPTDDVNQADLVVVSPGQLQLIADGVVLPEGHPFCIHPPFAYRFDIGTLPAGAYSLQFLIRDDIGGSGLVGFGSVDFTVTRVATIPASSKLALTLLAMLLAGGGLLLARKRLFQQR